MVALQSRTATERAWRRTSAEDVARIEDLIRRRIDLYSEVLYGVHGYVSTAAPLGHAGFRDYVTRADIITRYRGIRALAWAQPVRRADVASFEAAARTDSGDAPEYAHFTVHPATDAALAVPVRLVEPLEGNAAALGYDVAASPDRREALDAAIDSGELIGSAPVRLVQAPDSPGIVLFLAVYDTPIAPVTSSARRAHLRGVVTAALVVRDALQGAFAHGLGEHVELYDMGPADERAASSATTAGLLYADVPTRKLVGLGPDRSTHSVDIVVAARHWRLVIGHRPGAPGSLAVFPVALGLTGVVVTVCAAVFVVGLGARRRRRREQVFQSFLEVAPDSVVVVDGTGRICQVNARTEELFGYDRAELLGQPVEVLLPASARFAHVRHRAGYGPTAAPRRMGAFQTLSARRKDGSEFPVEVSLGPLRVPGEHLVAAAVRDATDRREHEVALSRALEREREAADRLREADRLKDEFLDVAAHELRTPLTAVLGFAQLLVSRPEMDEARRDELLDRLLVNAKDMADLVTRLLDFSRLAAGRVDVDLRPLRLAGEVADAVRGLDGVRADHAVDIVVDDAVRVVADPNGLRHVVANLLTNAAKFSPAGSTITVASDVDRDHVVLRVTDQGSGVAPEDLPHLFERFYQGANRPPGKAGTGVGLSIVARYVELMGGRVWVESPPGSGASFFVALPKAPAAIAATTATAGGGDSRGPSTG